MDVEHKNSDPRRFRVPFRDNFTSCLGIGPIPFTKVILVNSLVSEGTRFSGLDSARLTPGEEKSRLGVRKRAVKRVSRSASGPLQKSIKQIHNLKGRIALQQNLISHVDSEQVLGPGGEMIQPDAARAELQRIREKIAQECASGSLKHEIQLKRSSRREIAILLIDFPVLFIAMLGLLNVSIARVFEGDVTFATAIKIVTAVVFAILGTGLLAYVVRSMGRRHRRYKTHSGEVDSGSVDKKIHTLLLLERCVVVVVLLLAAGVMASRILFDGFAAGAPWYVSLLIAFFFSAIFAITAYINYRVEFESGSSDVERMQILSRAIARHDARVKSLNLQLVALHEALSVARSSLERALVKCEERALDDISNNRTERAMCISRSYQAREKQASPEAARFAVLEAIRAQNT